MNKDNLGFYDITIRALLNELENDSNELTYEQISVYKRLIASSVRSGEIKDLIEGAA